MLLEGLKAFFNLIEVDPIWGFILLGAIILWGIVSAKYKEYEIRKTKDEDGNEVYEVHHYRYK